MRYFRQLFQIIKTFEQNDISARIGKSLLEIAKTIQTNDKMDTALPYLNQSAEFLSFGDCQEEAVELSMILVNYAKEEITKRNFKDYEETFTSSALLSKIDSAVAEAKVFEVWGDSLISIEKHKLSFEKYENALKILSEAKEKVALTELLVNSSTKGLEMKIKKDSSKIFYDFLASLEGTITNSSAVIGKEKSIELLESILYDYLNTLLESKSIDHFKKGYSKILPKLAELGGRTNTADLQNKLAKQLIKSNLYSDAANSFLDASKYYSDVKNDESAKQN